MKSLKQLVDNYGGFLTDEQIILKYFVDNEMEDKAIDMMKNISQEKIKKQMNTLNLIRENSPIVTMNMDGMFAIYGKENAPWVAQIQLWFINHMEVWSDELNTYIPKDEYVQESSLFKLVSSKMKDINFPKNAFFFRPCLEWLHSKGIYFKNEVKND